MTSEQTWIFREITIWLCKKVLKRVETIQFYILWPLCGFETSDVTAYSFMIVMVARSADQLRRQIHNFV